MPSLMEEKNDKYNTACLLLTIFNVQPTVYFALYRPVYKPFRFEPPLLTVSTSR